MPSLSVLIKPVSSLCNLKCKYCFYHSVSELREVRNYGVMDVNTLESIVRKALEFSDFSCTFAFQGGEPTLRGLGFFKHFIELQKKYNLKNVQIYNAIQTNGIVIDDEWAKFLSENNFLVGISLDGTKEIHDSIRINSASKGSFNKVMNSIKLFNKYNVQYNILCVVNSYVARHINKVYSFFKKNDFSYLQFIPCLDPLNQPPGLHEYSLTPERYSYFLKNLFDLWYDDISRGNFISIRYFENLVQMVMGQPPELCGMTGQCNCQFVIEADGGVYPCDFYVLDEWYLGNIKDLGFPDLKYSDAGKKFVETSIHIDEKCTQCKWLYICRGGCRRNREPFINGLPSPNYYCSSYYQFFDHAFERIKHLAQSLSISGHNTHSHHVSARNASP